MPRPYYGPKMIVPIVPADIPDLSLAADSRFTRDTLARHLARYPHLAFRLAGGQDYVLGSYWHGRPEIGLLLEVASQGQRPALVERLLAAYCQAGARLVVLSESDEAPSRLTSRNGGRDGKSGRDGASEAAAARRPLEPVSEPPAPAKPRVAARSPGRQEARYTEKPQTTIRLAGDSSPVLKQIRQKLTADERAAYEHLVRLYAHERASIEDGEAWQLYCLWQTYGFSGLVNALQGASEAPSLAEVNHTCVLAEVLRTYEQEVGRVTPGLHKELEKLTEEFPVLEHWQEAFRVAVRINRRRLSTIETVLKNLREKEQGEAAARETARAAANGSRPRRATKRRAPARPPAESPGKEAAKSGEEWTLPPE